MLLTKGLAGVAPEVNLRNPLHAGDEEGIHLGFETQGRHPQKSKIGVSVDQPKELISSKLFLKII